MDARARIEWFNTCYEHYYDPLLARARCYAGRDVIVRNELEDIVIETYEIAWERYEELRTHPNMMGWLTKTVYNKLDNFNTRGSTRLARRSISVEEEAFFVEDEQAARKFETWAQQEEHREIIDRILKMLTQSEREIFEDYFVRRKTATDIMRKTGTTLSSVRAAIRRIRKKAQDARGKERGN